MGFGSSHSIQIDIYAETLEIVTDFKAVIQKNQINSLHTSFLLWQVYSSDHLITKIITFIYNTILILIIYIYTHIFSSWWTKKPQKDCYNAMPENYIDGFPQ